MYLKINACNLIFCSYTDITKSISNELQCNLRTKEISSLCVDAENNSFLCIYFSVDQVPHDMIKHFIDFDRSKLFESIWNEICGKLDETNITTFSDVYVHVWKETIAGCKDLLDKLCKKSFTHSDIERFTNLKDVNLHVTTLYNAMGRCYHSLVSSLPNPKQWIPQAATNVTLYLDYTKNSSNTMQVNAVQLCMKLKELLKLKGDFSVLHNLNSQVCVCYKIMLPCSTKCLLNLY